MSKSRKNNKWHVPSRSMNIFLKILIYLVTFFCMCCWSSRRRNPNHSRRSRGPLLGHGPPTGWESLFYTNRKTCTFKSSFTFSLKKYFESVDFRRVKKFQVDFSLYLKLLLFFFFLFKTDFSCFSIKYFNLFQ